MSNPKAHKELSGIKLSPTLTQVKAVLQHKVGQLVQAREDLKTLWLEAENRMLVHSRINKYRNKAEKVRTWSTLYREAFGGSGSLGLWTCGLGTPIFGLLFRAFVRPSPQPGAKAWGQVPEPGAESLENEAWSMGPVARGPDPRDRSWSLA